jgi:hypothetical protein
MAKQKLTPSEIETFKSFIVRYEDFSVQLEKFQLGLNELDTQKLDLMSGIKSLSKQLDKVRETEAEYTNELISKYGEFNLDLETFEIEIT